MRRALCLCCILLLLVGCGAELTREEAASLAAKGYYDHLLAGEYDEFLLGRAGADSLPAAYREQLLTAYRQFLAQQQEQHQGVCEVHVSNAKSDTLQSQPLVNVFLLLCFGDSTSEEVVQPMVEHGQRWQMK